MAAKSLGPASVSHPDAAHVPKYLHPCVDYQICILRDVSPKSQIPVLAHVLSTARARLEHHRGDLYRWSSGLTLTSTPDPQPNLPLVPHILLPSVSLTSWTDYGSLRAVLTAPFLSSIPPVKVPVPWALLLYPLQLCTFPFHSSLLCPSFLFCQSIPSKLWPLHLLLF